MLNLGKFQGLVFHTHYAALLHEVKRRSFTFTDCEKEDVSMVTLEIL